jgi:hypothetical protein
MKTDLEGVKNLHSVKFTQSVKNLHKDCVKITHNNILEDNVFASQISEVLDTSFFELKYLQVFIDIIIKYKIKCHNKTKQHYNPILILN